MAELLKIRKSNNLLIEDLEFLGVGQNIDDASKPTTRCLSVRFETKKGTEISFRLYMDEVAFIKKEILKWEEEKEYFKKYKKRK